MSKPQIRIVGPELLQTKILAQHLRKETGAECVCEKEINFKRTGPGDDDGKHLLLLDFKNLPWQDFAFELSSRVGAGDMPDFALFEFSPDHGPKVLNMAMLSQGLRGIFNEGEPLDTLARGVNAIFNGELWIPRKIMSRLLMETKPKPAARFQESPSPNLTSREEEILLKIASGASNKAVADKLFISPDTVRTHAHNIFVKIGVTSRLQAALWVAKHL